MITLILNADEKVTLLRALRFSLDEREEYLGNEGPDETKALQAEIERTKALIARIEELV